jgi:hypothetical protein
MAKTPPTPPKSNPAVDPFRGVPFNPFPSGSPLAGNAAAQRQARGVNVQPVEEQTRATGIPADIAAGRAAPTFAPTRTQAPFDARQTVPVPVKPQAGGSES